MVGIDDYLAGLGKEALSLHHYIIKVLGTLAARITLGPRIGHSTNPCQVATVCLGIEEQAPSEHLETGEVAGCSIVAVLDDIHLHLGLILLHEILYHGITLLHSIVAVGSHPHDRPLQISQFQAQDTYGITGATALHCVPERHVLQTRLHCNGLRTVDGQVHTLAAYPEAIEFGSGHSVALQFECPALIQPHRVHHLYSIAQRDMLQIHDRVGGIRHMAIHTELSLVLA